MYPGWFNDHMIPPAQPDPVGSPKGAVPLIGFKGAIGGDLSPCFAGHPRCARAPQKASGSRSWGTLWPQWCWSFLGAFGKAQPQPTRPTTTDTNMKDFPSGGHQDEAAGIYKKLVFTPDGTKLLGGILVGAAWAW